MYRLAALCLALLVGCADDFPARLALSDVDPGPRPPADAEPPPLDALIPGLDGDAPDGDLPDDRGLADGAADRGALDLDLPDLALDAGDLDLDLPDADLPDRALPDLDLPDRALLDLDLPDLDPPDLDPPDLDLPDLDLPIPDRGVVAPEVCNGLDDDQNGVVDDAPVCAGVIATRCRVFLGHLNGWGFDLGVTNDWGNCPGEDTDGYGALDARGCVGTRRDGAFRRIGLTRFDNLDSDNHFAIALRCDGHPIAAWTQTHCRAHLGQADNNAARGAQNPWERCPAAEGVVGSTTCVSSGGDGRFHPMRLLGGVDANDDFAVAFICHDPADPSRGEAMQSSAAIVFAWANRNGFGGGDGSGDWVPGCPGRDGDGVVFRDGIGCASSAFDGRFHHFPISEDVGDDDGFGIALIPHPDAP